MQAVVATGAGEGISVKSMEKPVPAAGEVLIQVKAAALNHRDVWISEGKYANLGYPCILGSDGAGVVMETGEGADQTLMGQEVVIQPGLNWGDDDRVQSKSYQIIGMPRNGTMAEYVVVPAENVYPKPAFLTFEEAAGFPLAGLTAYRALFTQGQFSPDKKLLITGIGGGVAQMVLQFALALDGEVWVTSSDEEKLEQARKDGAAGGLNYKQEGWGKEAKSMFDVIIDSAGGKGFAELAEAAAPAATIVIYGGTAGTIAVSPQRIFWKQLTIKGSTMGTPDEFDQMLDFLTKHQIHPVIDQVFDLKNAPAAFARMKEKKQYGKIVLTV